MWPSGAADGIAAECVTEPCHSARPRHLSAKLLIQPGLGKSPFLGRMGNGFQAGRLSGESVGTAKHCTCLKNGTSSAQDVSRGES